MMLDRVAVQPEYRAWRMGEEVGQEIDELPTFETMDEKPPKERRRYYGIMRNKALRFGLVIRIAIDDDILDFAALADIQYGMVALRQWYYAKPQQTH